MQGYALTKQILQKNGDAKMGALMVVMLLTLNRDSTTVGTYGGIICGIQCVILIASCFPTEFALKKKFDTEK